MVESAKGVCGSVRGVQGWKTTQRVWWNNEVKAAVKRDGYLKANEG